MISIYQKSISPYPSLEVGVGFLCQILPVSLLPKSVACMMAHCTRWIQFLQGNQKWSLNKLSFSHYARVFESKQNIKILVSMTSECVQPIPCCAQRYSCIPWCVLGDSTRSISILRCAIELYRTIEMLQAGTQLCVHAAVSSPHCVCSSCTPALINEDTQSVLDVSDGSVYSTADCVHTGCTSMQQM